MLLTRRTLLVAGAALACSMPVLARASVRLADFGGRANGEDASDAFARAIATAALRGLDLELDEGTTLIASAPGQVMDALTHDCPEVRYASIRIRGQGSARTRLLCRPSPTLANRAVNVSRPILKSVGADEFSLTGVTLDGGIDSFGRGLRKGPDPSSAALLEVRSARRCELSDIVLTRFAGHWDDRDPHTGAYGRRGPLLLADCNDVSVNGITLKHPTYREGVFIHNAGRVLVRGFQLRSAGEAGRLSTPLHITGPKTGDVAIEDFTAQPAWTGSLLNLGGPGRFSIRRLRATGLPAADLYATGEVGNSAAVGRGIDIGAEINSMMFPGQAATTLLRLEDVILDNSFVYGIRATRTADCRLGRLSLGPGVRMNGGGRALDACFVENIDGAISSVRRKDQLSGAPGVLLRDCARGALAVDLTDIVSEPFARLGDEEATENRGLRSSFGVVRLRAGTVRLSGRINGFGRGAVLDDVAVGEDGLFDSVIDGLDVTTSGAAAKAVIRMGRGPKRRLRSATLKHCRVDGARVGPSDPSVSIAALLIDG